MKKVFTLLFATFYTLLSIGATVNIHYCGGELSSVKFYSNSSSCCCKTVSKKDMKNCCKDETEFVQFDELQHPAQNLTIKHNLIAEFTTWNSRFSVIVLETEKNEIPRLELPPPKKISKYISNSSLIFYA